MKANFIIRTWSEWVFSLKKNLVVGFFLEFFWGSFIQKNCS
jgi:hypothetical protein